MLGLSSLYLTREVWRGLLDVDGHGHAKAPYTHHACAHALLRAQGVVRLGSVVDFKTCTDTSALKLDCSPKCLWGLLLLTGHLGMQQAVVGRSVFGSSA